MINNNNKKNPEYTWPALFTERIPMSFLIFSQEFLSWVTLVVCCPSLSGKLQNLLCPVYIIVRLTLGNFTTSIQF